MNHWDTRFKNHAIHQKLKDVFDGIEQAQQLDQAKNNSQVSETLQRTKVAVKFIKSQLGKVNAELLISDILEKIVNPLTEAEREITNFIENKNSGHITSNLTQHIDQALAAAYALPVRLTPKGIKDFSEAAKEYKDYVSQLITELSDSTASLTERLDELNEQINELSSFLVYGVS